jgi:hypothetical protein
MSRSFSLKSQLAWLAAVASLLLSLGVSTGVAFATGPTPVACANLETAINGATEGEVFELSESCVTNVDVTSTKAFTLQGNGSAVLSPKTSGTPIIRSTTEGMRFTLQELVFKNGMSTDEGGAIDIESGKESVTLHDDTFLANTAGNGGGAVYITDVGQAGSEPTVIEGDTFGAAGEGNRADGIAGGGAYLRLSGPLRVTGNSFLDNEVTSNFGGGGGLDLEPSDAKTATAPIEVLDNTFTENRVLDSGGGAFIEAGDNQTVTLEGNLFSANRVAGTEAEVPRQGGGLVFAIAGFSDGTSFHVVQAHNKFVGNTVEATEATSAKLAAGGGGEWVYGVDVQSTADVFKENRVTVDEGEPPEGGGLGVLGSSTHEEHPQLASFTGVDDLFLGNSVAAGGWGGAIYTGYQNAGCQPIETCTGSTTLVLDDSTVYANEVKAGAGSQGGALWGSPNDSLTVANSIIFGNSPQPEVWGYATGAAAPTFEYSDVCAESGGPLVPTGEGNICANPQLNGSGEETASSPTIDAGSNALVPAGLATDAFGNTRILAGRLACVEVPKVVDMGADEFTTSQLAVPPCAPLGIAKPVPGLTQFVSIKVKANSVALKLSCKGTSAQICSGGAEITTAETLKDNGKKIVAVSSEVHHGIVPDKIPVKIAEAPFSLAGGSTTTIQLKLNKTGLGLLKRFHAMPSLVLGSEATASGPFLFIFHGVRFSEAKKPKKKKHKRHHHSKRH